MACWITFFADGARRNSSRSVLYSRLGDAGFLCADGMITLLRGLYGNSPCLARVTAHRYHRPRLPDFGTMHFCDAPLSNRVECCRFFSPDMRLADRRAGP